MKVSILGSSGQIGAYLTEYLRIKGHTVKEFDIVNGPAINNDSKDLFPLEWIKVDL